MSEWRKVGSGNESIGRRRSIEKRDGDVHYLPTIMGSSPPKEDQAEERKKESRGGKKDHERRRYTGRLPNDYLKKIEKENIGLCLIEGRRPRKESSVIRPNFVSRPRGCLPESQERGPKKSKKEGGCPGTIFFMSKERKLRRRKASHHPQRKKKKKNL